MIRGSQGFTLVEILTALVIIVVASISALSYFQYGLGGIHSEGNRRAALEIARGRMDQLLATDFSTIKPLAGSTSERFLTCAGTPCVWTQSTTAASESVSVNGVAGRKLQTTVKWRDDSPGNGTTDDDILEISVKAWYRGETADLDSNRVELRSLRSK